MEIPTTHEYNVLTKKYEGYLFVQVLTVALVPEVYHPVLKDARDVVLEERLARLMFEYEAANALTEDETFDLMTELVRVMPGMRIAVVAREERHRTSLNFAQAYGIATDQQLRSFANIGDAKKWLLNE